MGIFKKKVTVGGAVSELIGYGPFKRAFSSAWSYQKNMASTGYNLFKSAIFVPKLKFEIDSNIQEEHERFAKAAQLSGNAAVLKEMEASIDKRAQFWLIAFTAVFVFGLAGLNPNGIIYNFIVGDGLKAALILPFCVALLFLAQWFRWSFWSYQMREKALWGFGKWLSNPKEWITNKQFSTGAKFMLFFVVSATFLNGTMSSAIAQQFQSLTTSGGDTPTNSNVIASLLGNLSSSDLSLQFLQNLFPSYFSSATGVSYSNDAVAQMLEAVNLTLLAIGSVLIFWFSTHAVVASASEGTVLGQRWHTVWVPVRLTTGVAAIVPYHGFCVAQVLMIQIVMAGCGLANLAWGSYVQYATGDGGRSVVALTTPPQVTEDNGTFNTILKDALCVKIGQYVYSTNSQPSKPTGIYALPVVGWIGAHVFGKSDSTSAFNMPTTTDQSNGTTIYNFGAACGSIAINTPNSDAFELGDSFQGNVGNQSGDIKPNGENIVISVPGGYNQSASEASAAITFAQTKQQAMETFIGQVMASPVLDDLASSVVSGGQAVQPGETLQDMNALRADFATYNQTVLSAAGTATSASNAIGLQIVENMSQTLGWASAGALEPQLIAISAKIDSIMRQQPTFSNGNPEALGNKQFLQALSEAQEQIADAESSSPNLTPMGASNSGKAVSSGSLAMSIIANPTNTGTAIMSWFYGLEIDAIDDAQPSSVDPLQYLSNEGMMLKSAGYMILGSAFALSSVKGAAQKSTIADIPGVAATVGAGIGVLSTVIPMIVMLGEIMLIAGLVMEYILPMLPYFIWVSAFLGYMIFAIEAIICAAFWGFSHIKADGEDSFAGQSQSYGYGIALIAIFYPTLMVIGLIMANVLLAAIITFINQTFELAQGSSSGGIADPIGFLTIIIAMQVFYISMIARCYRLISGLPDWCSRWLGISASSQRDDTHNEVSRFSEGMQNKISQQSSQLGVGRTILNRFGK